ncbi:hypothetical protein WJX81_006020 [Elliptochloris bilobata]|uniref:Uncharacterized protein n=1 Tax=Elliptochloris bilobata TaxID=381761 RepID=A0AAW1R3L6_9CHLO
MRRCLSTYNGCKWRGGVLRVEAARPAYHLRLVCEWAADAAAQQQERERAPASKQEAALATEAALARPPPELTLTLPNSRKVMKTAPAREEDVKAGSEERDDEGAEGDSAAAEETDADAGFQNVGYAEPHEVGSAESHEDAAQERGSILGDEMDVGAEGAAAGLQGMHGISAAEEGASPGGAEVEEGRGTADELENSLLAGLAALLPAGAAFCRPGAGRAAELARRGQREALVADYKRKRREALRRAAAGKRHKPF